MWADVDRWVDHLDLPPEPTIGDLPKRWQIPVVAFVLACAAANKVADVLLGTPGRKPKPRPPRWHEDGDFY